MLNLFYYTMNILNYSAYYIFPIELVVCELRFHTWSCWCLDLQIFKNHSVLPTKSCCSFIYFSFLKDSAVASLGISHQMPRCLYGSCSSISVSDGPGHVQTLIKIWLKYPLLFVRWSQAHALCWTLHYVCTVCIEMCLLFVRLIVPTPSRGCIQSSTEDA